MSYPQLSEHFREIAQLEQVAAIVHWDEAVMTSAAGGPRRADAQAALGVVIHRLRVDPRIAEWIAGAEAQGDALSQPERANLREIRRGYLRSTAVPADLVAALSRASSRCEQAWRAQRAESDWEGHRPLLEEVVNLVRQQGQALGEALGLGSYDALLDGYEPGMRSADIDPVFDELAGFLPPLLGRVRDRQQAEEVVVPQGPFSIDAQRQLGLELMASAGFDFERGRLDVSHHPFCGGVPDDVRITTRYDEADFTSALMGVLHETGHAKYEQGLPEAWNEQPVGLARSMAVHESQSLLTEMQVCRSPAFVRFVAPRLRAAFAAQASAQPAAFEVDNLVRLYSRVQPGFIRVDADEVSYPLHVLLRYRLETQLVSGDLTVADLPEAWDTAMTSLLGLSTGSLHRDGCMQDVHWAAGAFGYFPTYTLGALLAAQLFAAVRADLPQLDADIEAGNFSAIDSWLRERVWQKASLLDAPELIEQATGAPLAAKAFRAHLEARYLSSSS